MWVALLLTILNTGSVESTHQISFDPSHESWQPLNDSTEIPFRTACWVKVRLPESTDNLMLKSGNWYMRGTSFYDSNWNLISSGNVMDLTKHKEIVYLYYPFIDEKTGRIELEFLSREEYLISINDRNNFQIAFQAVYIFLTVALLLFAIRSKDRVYWHFFFYVLSIAYFFAYQYGLLGEILPFVDRISPTWIWISSASLTLAYSFFAQSFLRLRENDLFTFNVFRFGQWFIGMVVVSEVIAHLLYYDLQHQLFYKTIVLTVEGGMMLTIFYRIAIRKDRLSRIFLLGMVILATVSLSAQFLSTARQTMETNNFIQLGMLADLLIFSVGISVRVGILYQEREQLQRKYTEELEETVKERTSELAARNQENELLLKEVHHRVKNNLQMINSLLNMQKRRLKDEESLDIMNLTQARVKSISLIHEHLYQNNSFSKMNLRNYIADLVEMLLETSQLEIDPKVELNLEELWVDIDTAIPIGLILNELVTNSIKYAFPTVADPKIRVVLKEEGARLILTVHDNGQSREEFKEGFGWTIIRSTVASLDGECEKEFLDGMKVNVYLNNLSSIKNLVSV